MFRPERPAHNAAACSDKGTDGTQRCGSAGLAAAITRQETESRTCVPTSTVHPEVEAAPAEAVGAEVSEFQGPGGAEATFLPEGPAHTATKPSDKSRDTEVWWPRDGSCHS